MSDRFMKSFTKHLNDMMEVSTGEEFDFYQKMYQELTTDNVHIKQEGKDKLLKKLKENQDFNEELL